MHRDVYRVVDVIVEIDVRYEYMRGDIVRTSNECRKLQGEWNALLAKSRTASLFMTWEWLDAWLKVQDACASLFVICIRSSTGELVGVAPYYASDYALLDVFPYRVLRIAGDIDSGAEYQTWIADRADEARVLGAIAGTLREHCSEWDLIWMPKLNAWSGANEPIVEALRARGFALNRRPALFSAISLPGEFDSYLAHMSANRRQQVRRTMRKILSRSGVEIRKVISMQELAPALESLFSLHNKRWRSIGQDGVFLRNPREKAFYEHFAPHALQQGWLALYMLLDDGEPKAVQIGYVYNGALVQLQEGFDPDYSPHVGNVLRASVIEDCIRNGVCEYDFLGGMSEHKRRWLAEKRIGMDLLVSGPHLKNILIMKAGIWPTGRYLQPRA